MVVFIGRPILRFLLLGIVAVTCLSITWMFLWTWNAPVTRVIKESPSASILSERPYTSYHYKNILEWLGLNESSSHTIPQWALKGKKPPRKAVSNWIFRTVPQTSGTTSSEPLETTSSSEPLETTSSSEPLETTSSSEPLETTSQPDTTSSASANVMYFTGLPRSKANRFGRSSKIDSLLYPEPSRLGFIHDFEFMINRDVCGEDPVDMLVIVGSHPKFTDLRKMLRETWGGPRIDDYVIKVVFFFGRPREAKTQQHLLDESLAYGDIIQGNFQDHYHNITYRDLMAFRWTWRQCPQARHIMRTDDDMVIDIDGVLQTLETQMPKDRNYLACMYVFHGTPVFREGQYGVSREDHPSDVYKPYCQGWTYWLTPGTCKALDDMALKIKPYWMNDAYLTGTLMAELGWSHRVLRVPYTNNMIEMIEFLDCPHEEKPLFAFGPSIDISKTRMLHKRFSLRAQKIGFPNRDPEKAPPGPYYASHFENCDSALARRNRPRQPWTGSLKPGDGPLPSWMRPDLSKWYHGMTPQKPGMITQQPGMVTQKPGLVPQQPGLVPQQPGMVTQQTGLVPQKPGMTPQSGMVPQEPGMAPQQPGMVPQQPGMVTRQPGLVPQQPGMVPQKPGMTPQPGMVPQEPGMTPQKPGMVPQQPGMVTQKPGLVPQQPGLVPQQPGLVPQQPGMVTQQTGLVPQEPGMTPQSGMVPQEPGMAPQQPGMVPQQPGMVTRQPGLVPQQPGLVPQQPGMVPLQPGLINQLPELAPEKNPAIPSSQPDVGPLPSGIPPQHPGLRPQLPGYIPDNPPSSLQNLPGLLHEQTEPHQQEMQMETLNVIKQEIKVETSIPKEQSENLEEVLEEYEDYPAHSYTVIEKRPQFGLRTQQRKADQPEVDALQPKQSFQWPEDYNNRQSAVSLN